MDVSDYIGYLHGSINTTKHFLARFDGIRLTFLKNGFFQIEAIPQFFLTREVVEEKLQEIDDKAELISVGLEVFKLLKQMETL